jgi:hypothetical protein
MLENNPYYYQDEEFKDPWEDEDRLAPEEKLKRNLTEGILKLVTVMKAVREVTATNREYVDASLLRELQQLEKQNFETKMLQIRTMPEAIMLVLFQDCLDGVDLATAVDKVVNYNLAAPERYWARFDKNTYGRSDENDSQAQAAEKAYQAAHQQPEPREEYKLISKTLKRLLEIFGQTEAEHAFHRDREQMHWTFNSKSVTLHPPQITALLGAGFDIRQLTVQNGELVTVISQKIS